MAGALVVAHGVLLLTIAASTLAPSSALASFADRPRCRHATDERSGLVGCPSRDVDAECPGTTATGWSCSGDGQITVCDIGDSTKHNPTRFEILAPSMPGVDNFVKCANPRRMCFDHWANRVSLGQGRGGTLGRNEVLCEAKRGRQAECDIVLAGCGYNEWADLAREEGACYQAWCRDDSSKGCRSDDDCRGQGAKGPCHGPRSGQSCSVPSGHMWVDGAALRCIGGVANGRPCVGKRACLGGAKHGEECTFPSQCPGGACGLACQRCLSDPDRQCGSDADCDGSRCVGPDTRKACFLSENQGDACEDAADCPGGRCIPRNMFQVKAAVRCEDAAPNVPDCPRGPEGGVSLCRQLVTVPAAHRLFTESTSEWAKQGALVVIEAPWSTTETPGAGQVMGVWGTARAQIQEMNALARAWSSSNGWAYIDYECVFRRDCPGGDADACLKDDVHPADVGKKIAAEAAVRCLAGKADDCSDCRALVTGEAPRLGREAKDS